MAGAPVDRVVRGHAPAAPGLDVRLPGPQVDVVKGRDGYVGGGSVRVTKAVHGVVLGLGRDARVVVGEVPSRPRRVAAVQAKGGRHTQLGDEVRVAAKVLLGPPEAWVRGDLEFGREPTVGTGRAGLRGDGGGDGADEGPVPTGALASGHGEDGAHVVCSTAPARAVHLTGGGALWHDGGGVLRDARLASRTGEVRACRGDGLGAGRGVAA